MAITYIPMARGFVYLAAVMDWYKALEHGTIVISHLILGFPGLPRVQVKREHRTKLKESLGG